MVTKEHRDLAVEAWNRVVAGGTVDVVAQAIADAEQRGRRAELSAVKAYLDEMGDTTLADHLEHGLHHPEGAADE